MTTRVPNRAGRRSWRLPPRARVWLLTGALAVVAVVLVGTVVRHLPAVDAPVELPWLVLALAFGLTEVVVVHVQLDREAHAFSLSDLVLVLGLYLTDPVSLVLAQSVGAGAALLLHRRQAPMKLAFNVAQYAVGTSLAAIVFASIVSGTDVAGPQGWAAAVGGVVVVTLTADLAIFSAISLVSGRVQFRQLSQMLAMSLPFSVGTAAVALVGVRSLWHDPAALLLLTVPALLILVSYRAFHRARRHHQNLQFVHDATVLLHTGDLESALVQFLTSSRETFHAGVAELILSSPAAEPLVTRAVEGAAPVVMAEVADRQAHEVLLSVLTAGSVFQTGSPRHRSRTGLADYATQRNFRDVMAVAVASDTRSHGVLLVANRLGEVSTFDHADAALFATLARQVGAALENGRLAQSLRQITELSEQLQHQAFHDPLTGLPNRALFLDRAGQSLDAARRSGDWPTMLYLDLDGFKPVNDALGHDAGDLLLQTVSARLRGCLRPSDTAARLGGDEFAVLLEGYVDAASVLAVADRIRQHIAEPVEVQGQLVRVGTSIGIASGGPQVCTTDQLISSADAAMYTAKRSGGGRFAVGGMGCLGASSVGTELKLAGALDEGQVVVYYQPIMDLATSRPVGAEALVRWEHPTEGLLLPDCFVPVAEQSGLILDLGRLVLREACREARKWLEGTSEDSQLVVTVNLSAAQLADPDLVADVAAALAETALDPGHLVLEITESTLMQDRHAAAVTLRRLKELGVRLAIDDFGTGYSSLAYLRRFPVDMLKIAREFTGGLGHDAQDDAITYAIVDLAMTLGLQVVAEGIETPDQHAQLAALGCPLGQGFLFTGAISATQVHQMLFEPAVPDTPAAHVQR